jgi:Ni/Co efflux regulator RcnB
MLLILSTLVWLAVVALVVAVCQTAAEGDARPVAREPDPPEVVREGLVVWDREAVARLRGWTVPGRRREGGRTRRAHFGRHGARIPGSWAKHRG